MSKKNGAAIAVPAQQGAVIALNLIDPSPTNPRKKFDDKKLQELAESIKTHGQLQPALVRPHPKKSGRYELVAGERRFRAVKLAGYDALVAQVRELDDHQVLEIQVIENGQREDVHPLEEADGYEALHKKHGDTVDEIAAKLGKSKAYVYARMKLCALQDKARKAFFDGKLSASIALLIARIPGDKLQDRALGEIVGWRGGEGMSHRDAAHHVQHNYMLRLGEAPFDTKNPMLVATAGACGDCPKRTGNQRELFADVEHADVCTDPSCYQDKVAADFQRRAADAKEAVRMVLPKKDAEKLFPYRHTDQPQSTALVSLDSKQYIGGKERSFRQLLGKQIPSDKVVLAQNPHSGRAVELLPKADLDKAMKAAGVSTKAPARQASASDERWRRQAQEQRQLQDVQEAVADRALVEINAKLATAPNPSSLPTAFWVALASAVCEPSSYMGGPRALLQRNGIENDEEEDLEHYKKLPIASLRAMALERALRDQVQGERGELPATLVHLCEALEVDLKAIEDRVRNVKPPIELARAALKIACPHCLREPGQKCHTWRGTQRQIHDERLKAVPLVDGTHMPAPAVAAAGGADDDRECVGASAEPGECRVCHCREEDACAGSCAWADSTETLCTECVEHRSEKRDDTWRRLFKGQGFSFQHIADRFETTADAVEAACAPPVADEKGAKKPKKSKAAA